MKRGDIALKQIQFVSHAEGYLDLENPQDLEKMMLQILLETGGGSAGDGDLGDGDIKNLKLKQFKEKYGFTSRLGDPCSGIATVRVSGVEISLPNCCNDAFYSQNECECRLLFAHANGELDLPPCDDNGLGGGLGGGGTRTLKFRYVYQYLDHLGNVRLSYSGLDKSGDIDNKTEILEEHNYYPFGLKHKGYNQIVNTDNKHKFRFNDTEFDDNFDLNWYNMPLRAQDPTTGRWNGIDPVTHFSSSTYASHNNNPIYWADPSGAAGVTCAISTSVGVALSNNFVRNGLKIIKFGNKVRKIGGGNDWFKSQKGDLIWQDSNKKSLKINGVDFTNEGTTANIANIDGTYVVYYQNIFLGIADKPVKESLILGSRRLRLGLMRNKNMTNLSKSTLMISSVHTRLLANETFYGTLAYGKQSRRRMIGKVPVPGFASVTGTLNEEGFSELSIDVGWDSKNMTDFISKTQSVSLSIGMIFGNSDKLGEAVFGFTAGTRFIGFEIATNHSLDFLQVGIVGSSTKKWANFFGSASFNGTGIYDKFIK